jgi:hypothetical protein
MGGLFVRSLVSGGASTAARYEAELARLRADQEAERDRLVGEVEFWRSRALGAEATR